MVLRKASPSWCRWRFAIRLISFGIQPSKTCLIYGAPGTGKTRLALWIARKLDLPIVLVKLDGLMSSFLGTTSRNIGNLFGFANRHRCLLLLDEFDAIAKLRDDPQEVGGIKRVVNALLQNLDARKDLGLPSESRTISGSSIQQSGEDLRYSSRFRNRTSTCARPLRVISCRRSLHLKTTSA